MVAGKAPKAVLNYIDLLKKRHPRIKKAYVFGSYAKGMENPDSDIDVAIIFESLSDSFDLQVQLMKLRRQFDTRIEPHVFQESDFEDTHPLAEEIRRTGIEIHI